MQDIQAKVENILLNASKQSRVDVVDVDDQLRCISSTRVDVALALCTWLVAFLNIAALGMFGAKGRKVTEESTLGALVQGSAARLGKMPDIAVVTEHPIL